MASYIDDFSEYKLKIFNKDEGRIRFLTKVYPTAGAEPKSFSFSLSYYLLTTEP